MQYLGISQRRLMNNWLYIIDLYILLCFHDIEPVFFLSAILFFPYISFQKQSSSLLCDWSVVLRPEKLFGWNSEWHCLSRKTNVYIFWRWDDKPKIAHTAIAFLLPKHFDLRRSFSVILIQNVHVDCSKSIIVSTVIAYTLCWFLLMKIFALSPFRLSAADSHSISPLFAHRGGRNAFGEAQAYDCCSKGYCEKKTSNYCYFSYREESHSFLWVYHVPLNIEFTGPTLQPQ